MTYKNKIFYYTLLTAAIFTAVLVYDRVKTYEANVYDVYTAKAEALSSTLAEIAATRIGRGENTRLKESMAAFGHLPSLQYLRISDTSGRVLFRSASPGVRMDDRQIDRDILEIQDGVYDIEKELISEGNTVGYMRIGVDVSPLKGNLENLLWRGIALGVFFMFSLAAILWLATRRLGSDMELLSGAANSINEDTLPALPSAAPNSDIWRISAALEKLHSGLSHERRLRKETEEVKSDFFAMAVHDLKQPVTILKAVHELIIELTEETGGKAGADVGRIAYLSRSSIDRLNGMIEDMLSIAKLSGPDMPVQKERLRLSDFMKECADEYFPAVEAAGKKWIFEKGTLAAGDWIYGDDDLLRRLIGNLIMNAIHYTPDGGVIKLGARLKNPGRAEIFVSDEGAGIPEGFRAEIFKKYSSLSKSARNVGLGLAFCKIVADKHSALLNVNSEEGKGTEISLIIPVSGSEDSAR